MTDTRREDLERDLVDAMAAVHEPADLLLVDRALGRLSAHTLGEHLDRVELYGVVDGRTGLHLTRTAADEALEARVRAECRPWTVADLAAYTAKARLDTEVLERMQARINETLEDLAVGTFRARVDTPRPRGLPGPSEEPVRESARHAAHNASPPPPMAPCAAAGSLGRHRVPAGTGVRSCPCGLVTAHPAP